MDIVKEKAEQLASGISSSQEISRRISNFVRDQIPYHLDEWDVQAHEVLEQGRGMCAGKALLVAELHWSVNIPARFKILKISGGHDLFEFIAHRLEEDEDEGVSVETRRKIAESILSLPTERDHILVQVLRDGQWVDLDVARDREFDYGLKVLSIWKERQILSEEGLFDSIEGWLRDRMRRRAILRERGMAFQVINGQIEKIRLAGKMAIKGGLRVLEVKETEELLSRLEIVPKYTLNTGIRPVRLLDELAKSTKAFLLSISDSQERTCLEEKLIDWLFALVRHNVKRGRFWNLFDVLTQRRADCLGYAQLFTTLAKDFGLDAGVIEVIRDCRGSYVPHIVCMVRLANGRRRLVDPWYGSPDIRHRLITARVKQKRQLALKTMTLKNFESFSEVFGLSPEQVCGIDFYILGNSFFGRGMRAEAKSCYDISIWLFPSNPRAFFNRAVALESMGREEFSKKDYQLVFSKKRHLSRILASIEDLEQLIDLDEKNLDELDQKLYLLRGGFITGRRESWSVIAKKLHSTSSMVRKKWKQISADNVSCTC